MMFVQRVNEDILLRMMKSSEHTELFALIETNRVYLQKWLPWIYETKSPADSAQFIRNTFEEHAHRSSLTAGIFYQEELAGVISFNTLDFRNKIGTIGYWLGESFQGKGIMTTSVHALIAHGFNDLQLNRLQLFAAVENKPSRSVAERLKFTQEGILKENEWIDGKPIDQALYRLLKSEWDGFHN